MSIFKYALLIILLLTPISFSHAQPKVTQNENAIEVTLDDHTTLKFALHKGMLLGLNQVTVNGVAMTSDQTVQRPFIAQEYYQPGIWSYMQLKQVRVEGNRVHVDVTLLGGNERELFEDEFLFKGNKAAVRAEGMTPELTALMNRADEARKKLDAAVDEDPSLKKFKERVARSERTLEKDDKAVPFLTQRRERSLQRNKERLRNQRRTLYAKYIKDNPELATEQAAIKAWNDRLNKEAMNHRKIHRDFYAFAHLRLPSESSNINGLKKRIDVYQSKLKEGGTLTWTFAPVERNIAGWQWQGWSSYYTFKLNDGHEVNNIRQVGTWEINGDAAGLTVVSMRYRGIGKIEQELTARASDKTVQGMWSTTEMLPHAAGQAALISPVVVSSSARDLTDRDYARRHRIGAWISKMARGAGMSFVDFQKRDNSILISYREKQGNFRALTEVLPGDRELSQTDEQWFANANTHTTEPVLYLALVEDKNIPIHEMRTRWQEVDQYVRDLVSEELDFVQAEPLPGVGFLVEMGRGNYIKGLPGKVRRWYDQGARMIVTHTPGWHSTQHHMGAEEPQQKSGNSNAMMDWIPTADVREGWTNAQKEMAKRNIPYYVYLTGMARKDGPFGEDVGLDQKFWGMNIPEADYSHGYPPHLHGHNVLNDHARSVLLGRMDDAAKKYGMQGHWSDSFQNMYMSQLNWGDGSGESMQRKWWEIIAQWSRDGRHWMSESHSFPGMSCSIEVQNWEQNPHYFQYTWKWLRGLSIRKYSNEERTKLVFYFMANKSWVAPHEPKEVPEFKRLADEYMAALPSMRRSYVLSDNRGILWLPYDRTDEAVVFVYNSFKLPSGMSAEYILDGQKQNALKQYHTYKLTGKDISQALGMAAGTLEDPRKTKTYKPVKYIFPEHTRQ